MSAQPAGAADDDRDTVVEACLRCGRVLRIPGVYPEPAAWMVIAAGGARSLHLERPAAEAYAARVHGVCRALHSAGWPV
jgi:hypothetical protein